MKDEINQDIALTAFENILTELPYAPLYPVSQLGKRIDGIIDLSVQFNFDKELIPLEIFSEKLQPYIKDREGSFSLAKRYIERGVKYLRPSNHKGTLKALDFFHKAKELYFNEATSEGFILAILSISQLYAEIGMNLAAKYYSLSAIWFCNQNGDSQLYKRISDSHALLMHSDFKQGSWINALLDFESYIGVRTGLDPNEFDPFTDKLLGNAISEGTLIIALTPIISRQLSGLIDFEKKKMGQFYKDFLEDGVAFIEKEQNEIGLEELVARKLENPPINDIGKQRLITWKAFGSIWNIEFENDYIHNSIAEEFCSLIQIIQVDISLSGVDLHLTKGRTKIQIQLVDKPKILEQLPSNSEYLWKVYLPILKSKMPEEKSMHYAAITASFQMILNKLSVLPDEDFSDMFVSLFKEGLGNKTLSINAYQRVYRDLFSSEEFGESMRDKFNPDLVEIDFYESPTLVAKKDLSPLYDQDHSIENISRRYKKSYSSTHLTLKRLNESDDFIAKFNLLKKEGWLDWQITLALFNNIIDLKAKNILQQNGKVYSSDEDWVVDLQKTFGELIIIDEKETYVEIPINEIIGKNLDFQIDKIPIHTLNSYGLQNKSMFPNSKAVRQLLNERFRFNKDEVMELSPFKNIKGGKLKTRIEKDIFIDIEKILSRSVEVGFMPNTSNNAGAILLCYSSPDKPYAAYTKLIKNKGNSDLKVKIKEHNNLIDLTISIEELDKEIIIKDRNFNKSQLETFRSVNGGGPAVILLIGYPPAESHKVIFEKAVSPLVLTWEFEE